MTASRERDRSLERLLPGSFRTPEAGVTDACLDAETLAAFSDGGLTGDALEAVETHLADCARCQSVLGAAVRVRTIAHDHEPVRATRRWFAWLVPLTAAAAALAIWVAIPRGPGTAPPPQLDAHNQAPQAKVAEPTTVPQQLQSSAAAANDAQSADAKKNDQPPADATETAKLRKDSDRRELDRLKEETPSDQGATLADKTLSAVTPAAPAPTPAAPTREMFEPRAANDAAQKAAAPNAIASVAAVVRWRIAAGALERSTDGGAAWSPVSTGVTSQLTAVAAPSPTICWVVGRAGVVLRTTDGLTFSRVAFPEVTDLAAIQAVNAQSATVTTTDGRVFSTSDGATWGSR